MFVFHDLQSVEAVGQNRALVYFGSHPLPDERRAYANEIQRLRRLGVRHEALTLTVTLTHESLTLPNPNPNPKPNPIPNSNPNNTNSNLG